MVLAAVHLTQGTSSVGAADLLRLLFGGDDAGAAAGAGRLPAAPAARRACVVGLALGVAGAGLQSLARNPLASPDTLAVNAGAYLAVVAAAAFGVSLPCCPPARSRSSAASPPPVWCWRSRPAAGPGRPG